MLRSICMLTLVLVVLSCGLVACNLSGGAPVCDPATTGLSGITPNYRHPVLDLSTWSIEWSYYHQVDEMSTEPTDCNPTSQHLRIGTRTYDENGTSIKTALFETDLPGEDRLYTPDLDLEPGGSYFWEITWFDEAGASNLRAIPFNTGPICGRDSLLPPTILSLPDGAVVPTDGLISWEYPGGCTPESIEVDLSSGPAFNPADTQVTNYEYAIHGLFGWEACRMYYWRVASSLTVLPTDIPFIPDMGSRSPFETEPPTFEFRGFIRSDYTEVRSFYVIDDTCPIPPPDLGPGLPDLPLQLPPSVRLNADANCRSGPSMDYPLLSVLPAGGEYDIQARNTPGDSWMVFDPAINAACWVYGSLVEVLGDTTQVMVIDPDPPGLVLPTSTPTNAPFNCAQYNTNQPACSAEPACKWDPNNNPNSPCVNK
jgi:uncharacterized protein YraI